MAKPKKRRASPAIARLRRFHVPIGSDGRLYAAWGGARAGQRLTPRTQKATLKGLEEAAIRDRQARQ